MGRMKYEDLIDSVNDSPCKDRLAAPYRREFLPPLRTGAGVFEVREGWILKETRGGEDFFGEVAPFPGFESEQGDWMARIERWSRGDDQSCLGVTGALGFGAWCLEQALPFSVQASSAGMISEEDNWMSQEKAEDRPQVVKVKIGINSPESEQSQMDSRIQQSGGDVRFRLDANQALNLKATRSWMAWLDQRPEIEFIEQPMCVGSERMLVDEFGEGARRIALDESVVTADHLKRILDIEWPGIFVIKPSLFGRPDDYIKLPERIRRRIVLSSAFETGVGFSFVLKIASMLGDFGNVHGFGTRGRFGADGLDGWPACNFFRGEVGRKDLENVFLRNVRGV